MKEGKIKMDENQKKSQETRQRNQMTKALLYQEKAEATRAARLALERVCKNPEATSEEILRAAELLTKLSASSCVLY